MKFTSNVARLTAIFTIASLLPCVVWAHAGTRFAPRLANAPYGFSAMTAAPRVILPPGVRVVRDVAYADDPLQTFDVYLPAQAITDAPVIFMVHGGGWRRGDKTAEGVVQNKVARWVPRGFIFISANYPLLPDTAPLQQARDVALALATAQARAEQWGGDPHAFIVMGHSAGAHPVSLMTADPGLASAQGALPWLGTVSLDSACLNVVQTMLAPHAQLYDDAFGNDPAVWLASSPYQQMHGPIVPFLAVCDSNRVDSCSQAQAFVSKAQSFGGRADELPEDMSHGDIDLILGLPSAYTRHVETFLRTLSPRIARLLSKPMN